MKKILFFILATTLLALFFSCSEETPTEPKDTESPSVLILYPANNAELVEGEELTIKADATDNTEVEKVEFYIDGSKVTTDYSSPYEYAYQTTGKVGTHSILAKAYDKENNVGTSNVISIKVVEAIQNIVSGIVTNKLNVPIANAKVSINSTGGASSFPKMGNDTDITKNTVANNLSILNELDKESIKQKKGANPLEYFLQFDNSSPQYKTKEMPINSYGITATLPKGKSILTEVYTDENGYYEITDLEEGNYTIVVSANYYEEKNTSFAQPKGLIQKNITLTSTQLSGVRSLSLTDGSYQINLSWNDITDPTIKGYNIYERHYISYSDDLSEDQNYFYPEYSDWQKVNNQPITVSNYTLTTEEYNARYGFYVLPVNIDDIETEKNDYTEIKYKALPTNAKSIADFSLTEGVGPYTIPTSTHEVALHMRFKYTNVAQTLQMSSWKVEYSYNNSNWSTLETHILPSGAVPTYNYGYTKTFSVNSLKGKTVYFRTNPQEFPSPDNAFTIENLVAEYSMDGSGFSSNTSPNAPTNPTPSDGATNVDVTTTLSWSCSDPDGDNLTYDIYFGTSSTPTLTASNQTSTTYTPSNLQSNTTYYWKVVAKDGNGGETEGAVWSFTTEEAVDNYITVTSPNGGENWEQTTTHTITWEDNIDENVKIELWRGTTLETNITTSTESDGEFTWNIASSYPEQSDYKIKITSLNDETINDESDGTFEISANTGGGSSCEGIPTVTYEGKTYNTVQIGDQCWFKENLNVGTMIISDGDHTGYQQTDNGVIEKYCYDNDEANCDTYGGLYEWTEAMQYVTTEGTQGICPTGWHIPTKGEYETLEDYVNDEAVKLIDESQTMYDLTPTNETGFSALFAGFRYDEAGSFGRLSRSAGFWRSTENSSNYAYLMSLDYGNSFVSFSTIRKGYGFSVRCLKD